MNCSRQHRPSYPLSDVLVDLGEFGLQVLEQPVQQLWHSPFLLGKAPLQHIKPAGNQNSSFLVIQDIPPSPVPFRLHLGMCTSVSVHQSALQWAKMGKNCPVKQQYCCSASPKPSHPVNWVILKKNYHEGPAIVWGKLIGKHCLCSPPLQGSWHSILSIQLIQAVFPTLVNHNKTGQINFTRHLQMILLHHSGEIPTAIQTTSVVS